MPNYRISTIANLLGVSDDTIRRWLDEDLIKAVSAPGPKRVDGASVARFLQERPAGTLLGEDPNESIRNHFQGLVVALKKGQVMSQVDLQCGPYRVVSLVSTEAVEELNLEIGSVATAQVMFQYNFLKEKNCEKISSRSFSSRACPSTRSLLVLRRD